MAQAEGHPYMVRRTLLRMRRVGIVATSSEGSSMCVPLVAKLLGSDRAHAPYLHEGELCQHARLCEQLHARACAREGEGFDLLGELDAHTADFGCLVPGDKG